LRFVHIIACLEIEVTNLVGAMVPGEGEDMNDRLDREAAEYFGVKPEALLFVPELLADLWELGSDPDTIVEWLRRESAVLETAMGRGMWLLRRVVL